MGRPRQTTKIQIPPRVKSFMPQGYYANNTGKVQLNIEEFECIRLLDYEDLSQAEAAEFMEVSRPTLTRIYDRARKKIAKALVEAKQICIEGGKAVYNGEWYTCNKCNSRFNNPMLNEYIACPLCGSSDFDKATN